MKSKSTDQRDETRLLKIIIESFKVPRKKGKEKGNWSKTEDEFNDLKVLWRENLPNVPLVIHRETAEILRLMRSYLK